MNNKFTTKDLVLTGILLGLGLIIPMVFHLFGGTGPIFLPMHISVLIGGFLLPPYFALVLGIATPLLSSVVTGMPPIFPIGIIMMAELGSYGLITSLISKKFETLVIPSLVTAQVVGRIVAGITVFILSTFFGVKMNPIIFVKGSIITGIPGILIQLILIPTLIYTIKITKKVKA
ncbi:hypothetical protein CLPU_11c01090 [Gottschalkia purinilytica]|uniref:ECF transporter S component n=1 Tax=Gottschalkia purinilytica TaxID=1503 RepID=A0A0L0W9F2_GOTPU|nr:ECF transporter S component [Gottschalkia purinilytica]KNF07940.1 hypothetical protein CLPU_11c01090 [Gottschalkia purinilytica]